jgi:hypothetical protein
VTDVNWAGYETTGDTFTNDAASCVKPAIPASPTSTTLGASFWVGLDSATIEQAGTAAYTNDGDATSCAWYEMYPDEGVPITSLLASR